LGVSSQTWNRSNGYNKTHILSKGPAVTLALLCVTVNNKDWKRGYNVKRNNFLLQIAFALWEVFGKNVDNSPPPRNKQP